MDGITVFQTDAEGYLVGVTFAEQSPMDAPGVYLVPAGCVTAPPPACPDGHRLRWADGAGWATEPIPVDTPEETPPAAPEEPAPAPTTAELQAQLAALQAQLVAIQSLIDAQAGSA